MMLQASSSSGLGSGCCKRSSSLLTAPASKKSLVLKKKVQKWIQDNDKSLSILTWLDFKMDGDGVSLLRCKICFAQWYLLSISYTCHANFENSWQFYKCQVWKFTWRLHKIISSTAYVWPGLQKSTIWAQITHM